MGHRHSSCNSRLFCLSLRLTHRLFDRTTSFHSTLRSPSSHTVTVKRRRLPVLGHARHHIPPPKIAHLRKRHSDLS